VGLWLAARPRFHVHYTPTYSSWLNQVERWFGLITQQAIRRGSFKSVKHLIAKINRFTHNYNQHCRPFAWTATADSIFQKLARLCSRNSGTAHQELVEERGILRLRCSCVHLTAMRGDERVQDGMLSYVSLQECVPQDHPLRAVRRLTDQVLRSLSGEFGQLYATFLPPTADLSFARDPGRSAWKIYLAIDSRSKHD
jgi:DDE superfamily endonuclease